MLFFQLQEVRDGFLLRFALQFSVVAGYEGGEMVLILHPARREKHDGLPEAAQHIMNILAAELPTKQAAELAAKITGESKKALYDLALARKDKGKAV